MFPQAMIPTRYRAAMFSPFRSRVGEGAGRDRGLERRVESLEGEGDAAAIERRFVDRDYRLEGRAGRLGAERVRGAALERGDDRLDVGGHRLVRAELRDAQATLRLEDAQPRLAGDRAVTADLE